MFGHHLRRATRTTDKTENVSCLLVPAGSPSRGGDAVKPAKLAHSFYSVLVSVPVFMALSTVFHSMTSPDNYPLSHSALLVLYLFLPYWSFQLYL